MIIEFKYLKQLIALLYKSFLIGYQSNDFNFIKLLNKIIILSCIGLYSTSISAQVSVNVVPYTYTEDFGTSPITSWTNNSSFLGWYNEAGSIVGEVDITNVPPPNGGGLYAYTCDGDNDRKIGFRPSNGSGGSPCTDQTCGHAIGLRLQNNSGEVITDIELSFDVFQLSIAQDQENINTIFFDYQIAPSFGAVNLGIAGWTNVPDLNWDGPESDPFPGSCSDQLQGLPCNVTDNLTACFTVTINPGEEIMLRWVDSNNPCNDPHFAIDNINVELSAGCTSPILDMFSDVQTCDTYTFPPITGTNLTGNEAYFTGPNGSGTQYNPGETFTTIGTSTIYIYDYVEVSGCSTTSCSDEVSFEITINPTPIIDQLSDMTVCSGEEVSIVFSSSPNSAEFDWTNTNPDIGAPSSAVNSTGINFIAADVSNIEIGTISVTTMLNGCESDPMIFDITVTPLIELTDPLSPNNNYCNEDNSIPLPNPLDGISGIWTGLGVSGNIFNPDGLIPGNITLTFSPEEGACADDLEIELLIIEGTTPTFDIIDELCSGDDPLSLPSISDNGIEGAWSGPGVSGNVFDPSGLNGVTVLDFTPSNEEDCANETSIQIVITPNVTPLFDQFNGLCQNDNPINLPTTSNNGVSGNWDGPGIVNNTFDPDGLDGNILLTFTPDASLCANPVDISISVSSTPNASASSNSPVCEGNTLELSASGGSTYEWSGPDGFSSSEPNPVIDPVTVNNSGEYTVTVTNDQGCTDQAVVNVTVTPGFAIDSEVLQNVSCAGGNDGIINVDLNGVPAFPFEVDWEVPDGVDINGIGQIDDLPAGTYGITITDANGCVGSANLVIDGPDEIFLLCNKINDETSPGAEDGRIDVSVGGGTPNFNISINPEVTLPLLDVPEGNYVFDELPPGTYTITVIDDNGCESTCSRSINSAGCPPISIILEEVIDPLCHDSNDGYIEISVDGGQGELSYSWSPAVSNSSIASNLSSGFYTLVVTDEDGCEAGEDFLLIAPPEVEILCQEVTPASSPEQNDGVASITLSGGVGNFNVIEFFTPSGPLPLTLFDGDNSIDNLEPGIYTITVEDANGCQQQCSFTISAEDCDVEGNIIVSNPISCNGLSDGELLVIVNNGSGNYSFEWDNSEIGNTDSPSDLSAGTYTVSVVDLDTNCDFIASITLDEPEVLQINCESEAISSAGQEDGIITVNIAGGSPNYTVLWSGPVNGSEEVIAGFPAASIDITNLPEGTYIIDVTDSNGCMTSCESTVNSADCPITLELTPTAVSCFDANDGSLSALVTQASGTITYNWTGPVNIPNTQSNPQNLPPGTYSLTVVDQDGCTASNESIITSPGELVISCNAVNIQPGEDFGSILVNIDDGTPSYEVRFLGTTNGSLIADDPGVVVLEDLPEGDYQIVVEDANGCLSDTCYTTIEVDEIPCDFDIDCEVIQNESEPNAGDGIAEINFFPGNQVVDINITDQNGPVSNISSGVGDVFTISSLQAGSYTIIVTDQDDCTASCMFVIGLEDDECDYEVIIENNSNIECNGDDTGEINVYLEGTWEDPTFRLWSSALFEDRFGIHDNLPAGTYSITVNDANGCTANASVTITQPDPLFLSCNTSGNGSNGRISWTGGTGGIFYELQTPDGELITNDNPLSGSFFEFEDLDPGVYTVIIFDENGCFSNDCSFTINEVDCEIEFDITVRSHVSCNGKSDGALQSEIGNANEPIQYTWNGPSPIGNSSSAENLLAGTYYVTVLDANDCIIIDSVTIIEPEKLAIFNCMQLESASGPEENDGSAIVSITGGTPNYTIIRTGPDGEETYPAFDGISFTMNNLPPGNNLFTLVDENGCSSSCQVVIEYDSLDCDINIKVDEISHETCEGSNDGKVTIEASSNNSSSEPFEYNWSDGVNGNERESLSPGTYTVTIIDNNECIDSFEISILAAPSINLVATINQPNCGIPEAEITVVNAENAVDPFNIFIDDQIFESPELPLTTTISSDGNQQVINIQLNDNNGCTAVEEYIIDGFEDLNIFPYTIMPVDVGDQIDLNDLNYNRNTEDVSISLFFNDSLICNDCSDLSFIVSGEGLITIEVTDNLGCFDQLTIPVVLITSVDETDVYVPNAFSPNGDNINDTFRPFFSENIITVVYFSVFDRWGNLLYTISNLPAEDVIGWDGRRNGLLLDPGAYIYQLMVEKTDGTEETFAGECTLLR